MSYRRYKRKYVSSEDKGYWLTFSDLMSTLLLLFILVMFASVHSYFQTNDELEVQTARLVRQSELFDLKSEELDASQQQLTDSERALIQQQLQLRLSEEAQGKIQEQLESKQKDLDVALGILNMQQEDLESARALLAQQQSKLGEQQATLGEQQAKLGEQQVQLDVLVGVRAKIVESLAEALQAAHVKAKVDEGTGTIALDANVMFDVGKSDLKPEGKRVLDQFLPVYLGVLMEAENLQNISEIIVEGHADSMGTYMNNLKLSQERALAVMEYMLSDENGHLSIAIKETLRQIGTANGRSYSRLIRDEQGQEDAQASRRVEFKFRMQDEQMIERMREILGGM